MSVKCHVFVEKCARTIIAIGKLDCEEQDTLWLFNIAVEMVYLLKIDDFPWL
jgi:hypothetical protein